MKLSIVQGLLMMALMLASTAASAQLDDYGNPVFNSKVIAEETRGSLEVISCYYAIADNINDPSSAAYITRLPSPDEYLLFARDLPSYFWDVHLGHNAQMKMMLIQKNDAGETTLYYNIVNESSGASTQIPCSVWGEISEKRAHELLALNVDSSAQLVDLPNDGTGLQFNGIVYRIQSYQQLQEEVMAIASQMMAAREAAQMKPEDYVRKETVGGALDFTAQLAGDKRKSFMHEKTAYSKAEYAVFLWGEATGNLGIPSYKKASKLWQELHSRKLTADEARALKAGFEEAGNIRN